MTVSAPLYNTVHPARAAAWHVMSTLDNAGPGPHGACNSVAKSGNSRANSPPCGVRTHLGCSKAIKSGSAARRVSASASKTVGRPVVSTVCINPAARSVSPNPGPRHSALIRVSPKTDANAAPSLTRTNMADVIWLATSSWADGGTPSVTKPAPIRWAARAAKRAAPVRPAPPVKTKP